MQFSLWGHKPCLWYLQSLSKNISSHIMSWNWHKDNKEGGGGGGGCVIYSSFLLIIISVFIFSFFLSIPWQSITKIYHEWFSSRSDFQAIFYLHQQFMFLNANCLSICLSVCFFWCLDYSRINEQIFIKKIFVGRTWPKEEVTKRKIWILFWIQKNQEFSEVPFQCIFNDFGFLLDIWGHGGRVVTLSPPTSEAGVRFPARPQVEKTGSCLPLVGSLQYRTLTNCMYWSPLPFQLPVVIWPVQCWKRRKTPNK